MASRVSKKTTDTIHKIVIHSSKVGSQNIDEISFSRIPAKGVKSSNKNDLLQDEIVDSIEKKASEKKCKTKNLKDCETATSSKTEFKDDETDEKVNAVDEFFEAKNLKKKISSFTVSKSNTTKTVETAAEYFNLEKTAKNVTHTISNDDVKGNITKRIVNKLGKKIKEGTESMNNTRNQSSTDIKSPSHPQNVENKCDGGVIDSGPSKDIKIKDDPGYLNITKRKGKKCLSKDSATTFDEKFTQVLKQNTPVKIKKEIIDGTKQEGTSKVATKTLKKPEIASNKSDQILSTSNSEMCVKGIGQSRDLEMKDKFIKPQTPLKETSKKTSKYCRTPVVRQLNTVYKDPWSNTNNVDGNVETKWISNTFKKDKLKDIEPVNEMSLATGSDKGKKRKIENEKETELNVNLRRSKRLSVLPQICYK